MARSREDFHALLQSLGEELKVYFQPPENLKITYPCIIYSINSYDDEYANNKRYKTMTAYEVMLIDKSAKSIYAPKIRDLTYSRYQRSYTQDNLNHYVFEVYF